MQHLLSFLTLIAFLILADALPLITIVVWLLCWLRLRRGTFVPKPFWVELILVSLILIPTLDSLLVVNTLRTQPHHYLFGFSVSFWGLDVVPAILALPAAVIYPRLPGYLLTCGAVIQTIQVLFLIMVYRGSSIF